MDRLPSVDDVIVQPPPPTVCDGTRDTIAITSHLDEMQFDGWAALNREAGINHARLQRLRSAHLLHR